MGYSEEDSWKISLAAMLHDVGKIMIPENLDDTYRPEKAEAQQSSEKYCTNCGKPLAEGMIFCTECGTKVN